MEVPGTRILSSGGRGGGGDGGRGERWEATAPFWSVVGFCSVSIGLGELLLILMQLGGSLRTKGGKKSGKLIWMRVFF